ncbi:MAG: hypothetical protein GF332_04535 [Candidatus Moranbacteria bacterium]|nr:hypothetical protein [Candidatus Moranbacteria bacterium]
MPKTKKKLGLALGSGGLRGFFHLGVLKCLNKHSIKIDYLAGSSMGALIATLYALYQDVDKIEKIMTKNKSSTFRSLIDFSVKGGLIRGNKFEQRLRHWVNNSSFKDTKIPLSIVTTDLVKGKEKIYTKGKIAKYLRASMSVPTMFEPVSIKGKILSDGGLTNPVPDDVVKEMGAEVVIGVSLDDYRKKRDFTAKDISIRRIAMRSIEILRYSLSNFSTCNSDFVIKRQVPIDSISFSILNEYFRKGNGKWRKVIKMGETETEKKIKKIKKALRNS